jgi:hypothetical protein
MENGLVSVAYNTSSSCARHFNPLVIGLGFFVVVFLILLRVLKYLMVIFEKHFIICGFWASMEID